MRRWLGLVTMVAVVVLSGACGPVQRLEAGISGRPIEYRYEDGVRKKLSRTRGGVSHPRLAR